MRHSRDDIRQRVQYLIEHGGIYPDEEREKRDARWWARAATILALLAAGLAAADLWM